MRTLSIFLCCGLLLSACDGPQMDRQAAIELIEEFVDTGYPKSKEFHFGIKRVSASLQGDILMSGANGKMMAAFGEAGFVEARKGPTLDISGRTVQEWEIRATQKLQPYIVKRRKLGKNGSRATVQFLSEPLDLKIDSIKNGSESTVVEYSFALEVNEAGVAARKSGNFRWRPDRRVLRWRAEFINLTGDWRLSGLPRRIKG